MKRLLILSNAAGGLYNFRFELIQRLINDGYEVYFSVPNPEDHPKVVFLQELGAKYIRTVINSRGFNPFVELKLIGSYIRIIKKINPDIILTYTVKPNLYGTFSATLYKVPVIMNITGIGSSLVSGRLKYLVKKLYKYVCQKASCVFFQNESNRNYFVTNSIADKEQTRLIPGSGVNVDKFKPANKKTQTEKLKFLFIGRIMKEKGIVEYLKAAEKITKKHKNIEFQILGSIVDNSLRDEVVNNENVIYLGRSDDVRNEIREVDCIVNPSYHEGMSNVLLEGAAMAKPLLASDIPGCREIVDEGRNGFLFEARSTCSLESKLIQFIELDDEQRKAMGERSRKKVIKHFDRNIVINQYIQSINKILEKR